MKRILCLIDTLGIGGGAERQMAGLASFLSEKGYKVDIVKYYSNNAQYAELNDLSGPQIIQLHPKNNKLSKLIAIKRHIKSVGGYDWVIAYKDGPAVIGCLLKLIGGKFKLIVSERNTNQQISKKDKFKFLLYRLADYVVPNSHAQADFITQNFPKLQNKVVTITNFTDTSHFTTIKSDPKDKLTILTVGRITPQKNILKYLEALNLLKREGYADRVHFDWYGDAQAGDDAYKVLCLNKTEELELHDLISFHPATKDIVKHYQACDIFCLPSIYEGFPNVICEAMSCGKPIVCSRVCDNPHIVQENKNGLLFDPTDTQSIYLTLKQVIETSLPTREEWSNNSRTIAESILSKESFIQKYIELIEG